MKLSRLMPQSIPGHPAFLMFGHSFLVRIIAIESVASGAGSTLITLRGGQSISTRLSAEGIRDALANLLPTTDSNLPTMSTGSVARLDGDFLALRLDRVDCVRNNVTGAPGVYMASGAVHPFGAFRADDLISALLAANGPAVTVDGVLATSQTAS